MRIPAVDKIPSKVRTRRQAKRERAQLKKLISTGLFRGKIDLRRAPSTGAKRALTKFADVIAGNAVVVKPLDVKSFKRAGFRVVGKSVVIPKRKGERIVTTGAGKIKSVRRTKRGTVRTEYISAKSGALKKRREPAQYAIPFNRGDHLEWRRFPSLQALKEFAGVSNSASKVFRFKQSELDALKADADFEGDEELTVILEEKMGAQYGASAGRYPGKKRKRTIKRRGPRRSRGR